MQLPLCWCFLCQLICLHILVWLLCNSYQELYCGSHLWKVFSANPCIHTRHSISPAFTTQLCQSLGWEIRNFHLFPRYHKIIALDLLNLLLVLNMAPYKLEKKKELPSQFARGVIELLLTNKCSTTSIWAYHMNFKIFWCKIIYPQTILRIL